MREALSASASIFKRPYYCMQSLLYVPIDRAHLAVYVLDLQLHFFTLQLQPPNFFLLLLDHFIRNNLLLRLGWDPAVVLGVVVYQGKLCLLGLNQRFVIRDGLREPVEAFSRGFDPPSSAWYVAKNKPSDHLCNWPRILSEWPY